MQSARSRSGAPRRVEGIATSVEAAVTCRKCQALLRQSANSEVFRVACLARLDGSDRYFLWESDDDRGDRVVLDDAGFVIVFASEQAAWKASGEESPEETRVYDLDAIRTWCTSSDKIGDCVPLLDAWNLFGDLPRDGIT